MPIVLPIACASVMCVPCVKTLIAGIEISSASTMLTKIHTSDASKKRNGKSQRCRRAALTVLRQLKMMPEEKDPLAHAHHVRDIADPRVDRDDVDVVRPSKEQVDESEQIQRNAVLDRASRYRRRSSP